MRGDAVCGEPGPGPVQKCDRGGSFLVGQRFGVGHLGMPVDRRMQVHVPTPPGLGSSPCLRPGPGRCSGSVGVTAVGAPTAAVRIARLRRERHLTQQALADLSGVPYNTLTKIEQGRLESTPHSVACFARAMRVEVSTIVGQPYKDDLRADELDVLIAPIRWALDLYDLGATQGSVIPEGCAVSAGRRRCGGRRPVRSAGRTRGQAGSTSEPRHSGPGTPSG